MAGGLGSIFSFLLSLVFIIILAIVSIRLMGRKSGFGSNQRTVRVATVVPLGANKTLQVVVLGAKRILVVGVGSQIESLASFEDEELAAELLQSSTHTNIPNGYPWLGRVPYLNKIRLFDRKPPEWSSVQERLETLRNRRSDIFREVNVQDQEILPDKPFNDILLDSARRQK